MSINSYELHHVGVSWAICIYLPVHTAFVEYIIEKNNDPDGDSDQLQLQGGPRKIVPLSRFFTPNWAEGLKMSASLPLSPNYSIKMIFVVLALEKNKKMGTFLPDLLEQPCIF